MSADLVLSWWSDRITNDPDGLCTYGEVHELLAAAMAVRSQRDCLEAQVETLIAGTRADAAELAAIRASLANELRTERSDAAARATGHADGGGGRGQTSGGAVD